MIISIATSNCGDGSSEELEFCRDDAAAFRLKLVGFAAILVAGVAGVAIPLVVGRKRRLLNGDGGLFVCAKAFAAGVILATGFVHMLDDGQEALTNPCLPWSVLQRFPFAGFTAMLAALGTLVLDFLGTQYYERKHRKEATVAKAEAFAGAAACHADDETGITVALLAREAEEGKEARNEEDAMHIVGMHAHAAEHRHSHPHIHGACKGPGHSGDHAHAHGRHDSEPELPPRVRHEVVSQILELGIVSHSVIIGLSLGVSRSPCTIRPLIAALSFHQFFEGFALGGCISQAQFRNLATVTMACFFAITTPAGIAAGASAASFYDSNSPRALVVEGLLDSVSAGILIYMALVDLIAADFMSHRMSCNLRLQVASYISLFVGAVAMSAIALWA